MSVISIHGAHLDIPSDWEDISVYRFAPKVAAPPKGLMTAKPPRQPQPNLIVTRHVRIDTDPPQSFLQVMNAENTARNASFKIVATGETAYHGRPAAWQDAGQSDGASGLTVYQRFIVMPGWPEEFVLVTLTGSRSDVLSMSERIGFVVTQNPGRL